MPGRLEVLGWEWGAMCGFEVVQMFLGLREEAGQVGCTALQ